MIEIVPGARVAWVRGPSGGLVIGTVMRESPRSPEHWHSRGSGLTRLDPHAPLCRVWECQEEAMSDDWPVRVGSIWTVPDRDIKEDPTWQIP